MTLKSGYQPRNNIVKDEKGDLLADSHDISNRWKNYFYQLLNVHNVSGRGLLLYKYTKRAIKLTKVIIRGHHCYQLIQNFIEYPSPKVESTNRQNYWRSPVWVST
jgi:hypothetical protein